MVRMWRVLVLFQAVSGAGDERCQPAPDGRCQFPFVMNDITLHSCTWYRSYSTGGYPWCASESGTVDDFWYLNWSDPLLLQLEFPSRDHLVPTLLCASQTQDNPYRPWSVGPALGCVPVKGSSKSVRKHTRVRPSTTGVSRYQNTRAGTWPHTTTVLNIVYNTKKKIPHSA